MTLTIALIDDHEVIREGMRRALEREPDIEVVAEAASLAEALTLLRDPLPQVFIVDIRLPDGNGLDFVKQARSVDPDVGLVVLTMYAGDDPLLAALDAGASAFIAKDASTAQMVAAARHAAAAPRNFSAAELAGAIQRRVDPQRPMLSPREAEVLALLADGLGVSAISRRLYISDSTTKTHISHLYAKLGAANRAQALMSAMAQGLLDPPNGSVNGAG
ncbi:MAG: response regulator transcription factor [Candidatus Nanopelagicales bacterium]